MTSAFEDLKIVTDLIGCAEAEISTVANVMLGVMIGSGRGRETRNEFDVTLESSSTLCFDQEWRCTVPKLSITSQIRDCAELKIHRSHIFGLPWSALKSANILAYRRGINYLKFIQNRWLLVEFIPCSNGDGSTTRPANEINAKQVYSALKQSVLHNFGDTGWGAVGLSLTGTPFTHLHTYCRRFNLCCNAVKYYSPTTNVCIIRVARDQHRIAWGAVTLLSSIEGQKYIPNVVHVSGAWDQPRLIRRMEAF